MTNNVTRRLAEFLATSQWQDIPDEVRNEAKRTILNFVGTALGGCRDEAVELAVRALRPFFGPPQATVIGRSERADPLSAAFLNAISANVLEFDDTHVRTVIHPAAPVAPALFGLSERRPVSGRELLHAFILGVETECRIGIAISPAHYRRGWHITSTCGVFGAAAGAGKLLAAVVRINPPPLVSINGVGGTPHRVHRHSMAIPISARRRASGEQDRHETAPYDPCSIL